MQTAVVWTCLLFTRSGQNHLAWHGEKGKKTRQSEEEVGRQHQGMDRPGVRQTPEGSGEQGRLELKITQVSENGVLLPRNNVEVCEQVRLR